MIEMIETTWATLPSLLHSPEVLQHLVRGNRSIPPSTRMVGSVCVIRVDGAIAKTGSGGTSSVLLAKAVRAAANSGSVRQILIVIDSVGGPVPGAADLAATVADAAKRKPTWAFVDDLCVGSAYWAASQAGKVFANNRTALVGAIGAAVVAYDLSEAADNAGIIARVFATGPLKSTGIPGTPITGDQAEYLQGLANLAGNEFVSAVAAGRGMLRLPDETIAGGAIPATRAFELGLIDGIDALDSVLAKLSRTAL